MEGPDVVWCEFRIKISGNFPHVHRTCPIPRIRLDFPHRGGPTRQTNKEIVVRDIDLIVLESWGAGRATLALNLQIDGFPESREKAKREEKRDELQQRSCNEPMEEVWWSCELFEQGMSSELSKEAPEHNPETCERSLPIIALLRAAASRQLRGIHCKQAHEAQVG